MLVSVDRSPEACVAGRYTPAIIAADDLGTAGSAAEHPGEYATGGGWDPAALRSAVDAVVDVDVDTCSDGELRQALGDLRQPIARLQAFVTRVAGVLEQRAIAAAPAGRSSAAQQRSRDFLAEELGCRARRPSVPERPADG